MFDSVEDVQERLAEQQYITDKRVATVVYLAIKMGKPILIEGPAGVGKTELAKVIASALNRELIRLQCYEGLDEAKALYEWEYSKQLLYTQILKDKISEALAGTTTMTEAVEQISKEDNVFFSERFLVPRPLMRAITSETPVVLLIDEVDKADPEFKAFLLEVLSDFQVSVPEIGTFKARQIPPVLLTSNNAREMSDALKRRCLHLYIDFPSKEQEAKILELKVPGIKEKLAGELIEAMQRIRKIDLKKTPSISETLDWGKALVLLNADSLDEKTVDDTLSLILKYEGDIKKAQEELRRYLRGKSAENEASAAPDPRAVDKTKLN
ncbi:MAG: MoxR family ATPase [Deltaproteobacteria bacterium]|nr:MoxR family ATPase [Deltaproteobacteria bacterium]